MKKNKKLSSINHVTNTKATAFLKWSSKLIISCMLVLGVIDSYCQAPMTAPSVEWEKSFYPSIHPSIGLQTKAQSGEDWFYSLAISRANNGNQNTYQNGYIGAGYNSFPGYSLTEINGCMAENSLTADAECDEFETDNHKKGMVEGMISLMDLNGVKFGITIIYRANLQE